MRSSSSLRPSSIHPAWPMAVVGMLTVALGAWWYFAKSMPATHATVSVYYTELDGTTERSWQAPLGSARDRSSVAFYAATQVLAGPRPQINAVRFPSGTHVVSVVLDGTTAIVDLSKEVEGLAGGSFAEGAAFKSLVWTMTALPGITSVEIRIEGSRLPTIPGGHFELDEPLMRSTW